MRLLVISSLLHLLGFDGNIECANNLTQSMNLPDLSPSISVKMTGLGGNPGNLSHF